MEKVKDLLRTGDIVTLRSGDRYKVLFNVSQYVGGNFVLVGERGGWTDYSNYNNLLLNSYKDGYDILLIRRPDIKDCLLEFDCFSTVIWERKEEPELTDKEVIKLFREGKIKYTLED